MSAAICPICGNETTQDEIQAVAAMAGTETAQAIQRILDALDLTPAQRKIAPAVAARELRASAGGDAR